MPKQKTVTVKNDDLEGQVLKSAVPTWEKHGWTVVDDGNNDTDSSDESVTYVVTDDDDTAKE